MAQIKYLDSRRIMGASTDIVENLNYVDENYSSSTGWTQVSTNIAISNGKVQFSSGLTATSRIYKALPFTADNTKWIIDFELLYSTAGNGDQIAPLCISDGTDHPTGSATNSICVHSYHNGAGVTNDTVSVSYRDGGSLTNVFQLGTNLTNGTRYYMRLERTSSTNVKLTAYSNSARTSSVTTNNGTIPSTLDGLTTIHHSSHHTTGANQTAEIDNLKFYDGVTGTPFTVTNKPKAPLSLSGCKAYYNFEQTAPSPDYETDFSTSTGWTQTGSNITINTGTNSLTWIGDRTTSSHGLHYDLGSGVVSSKWLLEFDFVLDNYSAGTASYTHHIGVMLTDVNSTVGTYGSDATRKFVGMRLNWRTDTASQQRKFYIVDDEGGTEGWSDNVPYNTPDDSTAQGFPSAGTTYHMKLIKDGSSHSLEIWNSSQTSLLDTLNGSNSTTADIRYILVQSYNLGTTDGNPNFDGKIQNMKFYNGVTSSGATLTNIATTGNGFADGLGSSADGTNNGATIGATGKLGSYAWSFDGINDKVEIGSSSLFNGVNQITYASWVYQIKTGTGYGSVICIGDSDSERFEVVIGNTGANPIYAYGANGNVCYDWIPSTNIPDSTWTHLAVVYDGTQSADADRIKFYINGSFVSSTLGGTRPTATVLSSSMTGTSAIGVRNYSSVNWFKGYLDETVLFTRVLSETEISALYNSGTGVAVNDSSLQVKPETNSIFIETDTANRWWFDGTDWRQSLIYNQQVVDNSYTFVQASAGNGTRAGIKVASGSKAIGKSVRYIRFKIVRTGSPSGILYCRVRNSSDTIIAQTSENANDVSTSIHEHDFDLGSYVTLSEGDRIMLELTTGSSGNGIWIRDLTSNTMPSGFEKTVYNYSSVYVDSTTTTVWGVINYTDL